MGASDEIETLLLPNTATGRGVSGFPLNDAWIAVECPFCGGGQALQVGRYSYVTTWLRCVTCLHGFVVNDNVISPPTKPLRTPDKLPPADAAVWEEVRVCLGAGAYMAAVMLCRKLLLHIAVDKGLAPENDKGRGPGFAECVTHLQEVGTITGPMLDWVEPIKDIGNEATHKIVTVTQAEATEVATFTLQLLVLAYEMRRTPVAEAEESGAHPAGSKPTFPGGISF